MPDVSRASLSQRAVLWAYHSPAGNGEPRVSPPVEIKCRWEFSTRGAAQPQDSTEAKDESLFVDRLINIESILMIGELEDVAGTGTGLLEEATLRIVTSCESIVDLKNRTGCTTYRVSVKKYGNTLPTVVS